MRFARWRGPWARGPAPAWSQWRRAPARPAPYGKSRRKDQGEEGRFRKFTREEIAKRGDNLDITWLKDESNGNAEDLAEPDEIAAEILEKLKKLKTAMQELEDLQRLLGRGE